MTELEKTQRRLMEESKEMTCDEVMRIAQKYSPEERWDRWMACRVPHSSDALALRSPFKPTR